MLGPSWLISHTPRPGHFPASGNIKILEILENPRHVYKCLGFPGCNLDHAHNSDRKSDGRTNRSRGFSVVKVLKIFTSCVTCGMYQVTGKLSIIKIMFEIKLFSESKCCDQYCACEQM